jgi:hypothetical protein
MLRATPERREYKYIYTTRKKFSNTPQNPNQSAYGEGTRVHLGGVASIEGRQTG